MRGANRRSAILAGAAMMTSRNLTAAARWAIPASAMLALFALWWAWDGYSAEEVSMSCAVAGAGASQQPELPKMRVIRELQAPAPVAALTWSSDGMKIAAPILIASPDILGVPLPSAFGNLIQVWSSDGHVIQSFKRDRAFFDQFSTIAFVGGNRQIATPMWQSKEAAFFVFDIESGEVVREVAGPYPDNSRTRLVTASPDQSVIAVSFAFGVKPVVLYSTQDWQELGELEVPANTPRCHVVLPSLTTVGALP
jgi:hypothetical protein